MFDRSIFEDRVEKTRELMKKRNLDYLVIYSDVWRAGNVRYLADWWTTGGGISQAFSVLVIPHDGDPYLFVGFEQVEAARAESWVPYVKTFEEIQKFIRGIPMKRPKIGFVAREIMPTSIFEIFSKKFPRQQLHDASDILSNLRRTKASWEIDLMEKAGKLSDAGVEAAINAVKEGVTEIELKIAAVKTIVSGGGGLSFVPTVGSGPNSAHAMRRAGQRRIRKGDLILLDFGATYNGYYGDVTRTVAYGQVNKKASDILSTVLEAQRSGRKFARPGVKACNIDASARRVIEEAGYGKYFIHNTGHGIGLDQEEDLPIGPTSQITIQPGMTFSIEAGVYISGVGGARVEDTVVATDSGIRSLNDLKREQYL